MNQRFPVVLGVLGFIMAVASFYEISGKFSDLIVQPLGTPNISLFVLGTLAIAISVALTLFQDEILRLKFNRKVRKTESGFETEFGTTTIFVHFGLLQTYVDIGRNAIT